MDIQQLFSKDVLRGGDIYNYSQSPFLFWCNRFAPVEEKDSLSDYIEMLMVKGRDFENAKVSAEYPGITPIEVATTEDLIANYTEGPAAVHSGIVFDFKNKLAGRTDLLVRDDSHDSNFGDFHYVVKEIKNAKHLGKPKYVMQAAFYNHILGQMQGYTPEHFYIVGIEGELELDYSNHKDQLESAILAMKEILAGKEVESVYGSGWPWDSYSKKKAIASDSITLIGGIGPSKQDALSIRDIKTVSDLHNASVDDLCSVKGIGKPTAEKIKKRAESLLTKKEFILKVPDWPTDKEELYIDFEGTYADEILGVDQQVIYLFGIYSDSEYISFAADSFGDEGKAFSDFLDYVSSKDAMLYHYHHYEKQVVSRLSEKYGLDADLNFVDASKPFISGDIILPVYSNSLKDIAPYLGFSWSQKDVSAQETMAMYLNYVQTQDKKILDSIKQYNEEDCVALKQVVDWVKELSN